MHYINNKEAETNTHKWFARKDASMQSEINKSKRTYNERLLVSRVHGMLKQLYTYSDTECNFRKTMVSIKFMKPRGADYNMLKEYIPHLKGEGWTMKESAQGLLFGLKYDKLIA